MQIRNLFFTTSLIFTISCANMSIPTGGHKDQVAPIIKSSSPGNKITNFRENKFILEMNEFCNWDNPIKKVMISPYHSEKLEFGIMGKKMIITLPKSLKPNRTYELRLDPGAIQDYNEANPMASAEFMFSTGSNIDSGKISVQLFDKQKSIINEMTKVVLVSNWRDFLSANYEYITAASYNLANFSNIGKERLFPIAFIDSNQNLKWEKNEPLAFYNDKVEANKSKIRIELFENEPLKRSYTSTPINDQCVLYSSNSELYQLELLDTQLCHMQQVSPKQFYLFFRKNIPEKASIVLRHRSTINDTLVLSKAPKSIKSIESLYAEKGAYDNLIPENAIIYFNSLIDDFNAGGAIIKRGEDTLKEISFLKKNNSLALKGLDYGSSYEIIFDTGVIVNASLKNSKILRYNITTAKKEDLLPKITIKLDSSITNYPYLIYLSENNNVIPQIADNKTVAIKNITKKELIFHIIKDQNNNKFWDTGNIEQRRQPEPYIIEKLVLDPKIKEYTLKWSTQ